MSLPAGHPPFSSFSSFHSVWAAKPLFYWLECKFVIFAVFVKNPFFFGGTKARFTKNTVSWTPRESLRRIIFQIFRQILGGIHLGAIACRVCTSHLREYRKIFLVNCLCIAFVPGGSGPVLHASERPSQRYPPIARYGVLGVSIWRDSVKTFSP